MSATRDAIARALHENPWGTATERADAALHAAVSDPAVRQEWEDELTRHMIEEASRPSHEWSDRSPSVRRINCELTARFAVDTILAIFTKRETK